MFFSSRRHKTKAAVLLYHRVAHPEIDPAQLAVSSEIFGQQLAVLSRNFMVISCEQLVLEVRQGRIRENCVCITFDDGYTDNVSVAMPLLEKFKLPATFFITTDFLDTHRKFWWDELADILLGTMELPKEIQLETDGYKFLFTLNKPRLSEEELQSLREWNWNQPVVSERCDLYFQILNMLKPMKLEKIEQLMSSIRSWRVEPYSISPMDKPMKSTQLSLLSNCQLFSVGVHTCTHPSLSKHEAAFQENEIVGCRKTLLEKWNIDSSLIAYPYGQFNRTTLSAARKAGLTGGFTTQPSPVTSKTKILEMGRLHVENWDSSTFQSKMENFFS